MQYNRDLSSYCNRSGIRQFDYSEILSYIARNTYPARSAELWDVFRRVELLYHNPLRIYHNKYHVRDCLKTWWKIKGDFSTPEIADAAAIALLYHDAVYDPHSHHNEDASAVMVLDEPLIPSIYKEDIARFITATKIDYIPSDNDEALVKDIDLVWFLWENMGNDMETWIRTEYSYVPPDIYYPARKKILRKIYARPFWSRQFSIGKSITYARKNIVTMLSKCAPTVAVSGTFDMLHAGHRQLLLNAIRLVQYGGRLVIGITTDEFASRKNHEVQPFVERYSAILNLLHNIQMGETVEVIPLHDAYGDIMQGKYDILVVSEETAQNGFKIVNEMIDKNIIPTAINVVPVIRVGSGERLSSTGIRSGEQNDF